MLGTRPTFSRRGKKQHKCCERYARDLLLLDFEEVLTPGEGGVTPLIPRPSILAVLVEGKKARGILEKTHLPRHGLTVEGVPPV